MKRTIIACTLMLFIGTLVASEIQFKLNGPTLRETPNGKVCTGLDFIQKYTDISALASLVDLANNDPCFKLGSTVNGSLVSPQFINTVRGGSPTGFGSGGFR